MAVDRPSLTFNKLRAATVRRCTDVFQSVDDWTLTDWALAMVGEAGEACNVVKKIRRGDYGGGAEEKGVADLAAELADVVIYADLLAARAGIDLGAAVVEKFNRVSHVRGSQVRL